MNLEALNFYHRDTRNTLVASAFQQQISTKWTKSKQINKSQLSWFGENIDCDLSKFKFCY